MTRFAAADSLKLTDNMARSDQLKALLRAYAGDDDRHFLSIATQMAADEAQRGHVRLADDLRILIEEARAKVQGTHSGVRAIPLAQPKGELAELLTVEYPGKRLKEMVLSEGVRRHIERVLREHRESARLRAYGLSPRRKLLLVGPPGTGKTMTAGVLAGELGLPLFTVRFDSLITKFMGESAAKLRLVFDALKSTRGVYLFDEFDTLGLQRGSQHDVAEMRRTLNMFLQLLEQDASESVLVAATNHGADLDIALFRRFDDIIRYDAPDVDQVEALIRNALTSFAEPPFHFANVAKEGVGESHADVVRACQDALKDAVLAHRETVVASDVVRHLQERRGSALQTS